MINALAADALPCGEAAPVLLMVSGGSDSTALLAHAVDDGLDLMDGRGLRRVARDRLHVLHVNHCLRGAASDGDEAFVVELCARLGVACTVRRVDVAALVAGGANMEEAARAVRYGAAWELVGELADRAGVPRASARIAVAHTADDRVETFLMRALTGAGAAGLAGMRAQRGIVVRPLLGQTRAELRAYLGARGIGWREDATNAGDAALRSYVRNRVVPTLTARNPSFAHTLAPALDVLADEDDLLERLAARELDALRLPARAGTVRLDLTVLAGLAAREPALARRALRRALADLYGGDLLRRARLEAGHIGALMALAERGAGSCTLPLGADARVGGGALTLCLSDGCAAAGVSGAPRASAPDAPDALGAPDAVLAVPGEVAWRGATLRARLIGVDGPQGAPAAARRRAAELAGEGLVEGRDFVLLDAGVLPASGALVVGAPRAGERMRPFGMAGSKLVSDVVAEAKVPLCDRPRVAVVRSETLEPLGSAGFSSPDGAMGAGCVWVGGIRLDARAAYGPATAGLIELLLLQE